MPADEVIRLSGVVRELREQLRGKAEEFDAMIAQLQAKEREIAGLNARIQLMNDDVQKALETMNGGR